MKKYEYEEKIYCDEDLSEQIDNYGGDLFDLYWELQKNGDACETTYYFTPDAETSNDVYETYEDLIENEFADLEVEQ